MSPYSRTGLINALYIFIYTAAVAQWVRALTPQAEGWVFEEIEEIAQNAYWYLSQVIS